MFAPISTLTEFIDIKDPEYIAQKLSVAGLETSIRTFGIPIKNVVVGEILSIQKAQDLNLCKVHVGDTTLDIITSASNIFPNAKVPVALPGAIINGKTIEPKQIKGILSQGMMLSASELGLEDVSDGILILDEDVEVGKDVSSILDFGEIIFECETTPNRGDLLSIIGIAREISALSGKHLAFNINIDLPKVDFDIEINTDNCYKYVGSILEGVNVKSSKLWLKKALWKMGLKTISNVVDITNYTMMMLGQPLHAFDKDKIKDKIIIRQATQESIVALDKKEYKLDPSVMVIADADKPLAIAGIIGGLDSAVSFDTKNVFLESALFDILAIRKASKNLKISTDASYRFERGIDIDMSLKATAFACNLMASEASAKILGYAEKVKNFPAPKRFFLPMNDYVRYTATEFKKEDISKTLDTLGISHKPMRCGIDFEVPSYRYYDIDSHIDLIEEIVRIKDFNDFESIPLNLIPKAHYQKDIINDIKTKLTAHGLKEVINLSFDRIEDYEVLGLEPPIVELKNPILPSFRFLRRYLTPSIIRVAEQNIKKHIDNFAIFEIANIFAEGETPHICMLLRGYKRLYPKRAWDLDHLKELIKLVNPNIVFGFSEYKFMHPYQQGSLYIENEKIGFFGKLNKDILEDALICEFRLYDIKSQIQIKPISKYPPVVRDISLIINMDFDIQKLIILIKEFLGDMLETMNIFDFYKGEQIEEDKKSVGVRLVLRAQNRSLEDEEVNILMDKLFERLGAFGVKLRFS